DHRLKDLRLRGTVGCPRRYRRRHGDDQQSRQQRERAGGSKHERDVRAARGHRPAHSRAVSLEIRLLRQLGPWRLVRPRAAVDARDATDAIRCDRRCGGNAMAATISKAGVEMIAGSVTSPKGFRAAGVHCGVKTAKRDLALVAADRLASAAALFTTNTVKAAPVLVSQEKIQSGVAQAIIINSGNANACTGAQGLGDARDMAALVARELGVAEEFVLVASTGVIGSVLSM